MAQQSSFYNADGTTRTYPSSKHIASKQHVAVYFQSVTTSTWSVIEQSLYELVNNSIVFTDAPDSALYSQIEIRVADTAAELTESPSDIAIVAGAIADISSVANDLSAIEAVSSNLASIGTVSASITNVNTVAGNITNVNTVAGNVDNVGVVATNITDVASVANTVVPNIVEILAADDNAAIATLKASEASQSADNALASENAAATYAASIDPTTVARKEEISGAVYVGSGTTAERPILGSDVRAIYYNDDLGSYEGWNGSLWGAIGGGATGGDTNSAFYENDTTITTSYTITTGKNAMTAGSITINDGVVVTIPDGSTWTVV